jgi:prepilin-type N-terminal cleavage/methylation domain-containing protein
MKKAMKSKKGMTLVEIVTVIAIIVILASVAYYGYIHIFKRLGLDQYFVEQTSEEKI